MRVITHMGNKFSHIITHKNQFKENVALRVKSNWNINQKKKIGQKCNIEGAKCISQTKNKQKFHSKSKEW